MNVKITDNVWDQASLPTKMGGLGIRKTTELSLSAYLSSVTSTEQGVKELFGRPPQLDKNPPFDDGDTQLHVAAEKGRSNTPLHAAAEKGLPNEPPINNSVFFEDSQDVGLSQPYLLSEFSSEDPTHVHNITFNTNVTTYFEEAITRWKLIVNANTVLPMNQKCQKE